MSVWTTKSLEKDIKYIVIKHYVPGINGKIHGVTFRHSFGVVQKDSKTHRNLKRMPVFKNAVEQPLTFLSKLPFITRSKDIQLIYGREVYSKYLLALEEERQAAKLAEQAKIEAEDQKRREELKEALQAQEEAEEKLKEAQQSEDVEKIEEIKSEIPQVTKCRFETRNGTLCKFDAYEASPSGYCKTHTLQDPKLEEVGINVPRAMTKGERKKFRKSLYTKLEKLKKQGVF